MVSTLDKERQLICDHWFRTHVSYHIAFKDIVSIVLEYANELEILKFHRNYASKTGFKYCDNDTMIRKLDKSHRYILADCEPVTSGTHCWRVQTTNEIQGWIMYGISEPKEFSHTSYSFAYGVSNMTVSFPFYPKAKQMKQGLKNNGIDTNHFRQKFCEIDMLLNIDKGTLNVALVGEDKEEHEAKIWNMPTAKSENGFVPHFNIIAKDLRLRIAKISASWYKKSKSNIFV